MDEMDIVDQSFAKLQFYFFYPLTAELENKEKESGKTTIAITRLSLKLPPENSFLRKILEIRLRRLDRRSSKLKKETTALKFEIGRCLQAQTELKRRNYRFAIDLLNDLENRFINPPPNFVTVFDPTQTRQPAPEFFHVRGLKQALMVFQKGK